MFQVEQFRLALGMALTFYASVEKGLKLRDRKFWRLVPTFVKVTGGKLVGGLFAPSPHFLNRVNKTHKYLMKKRNIK